jgi:ribosomal protein L37E
MSETSEEFGRLLGLNNNEPGIRCRDCGLPFSFEDDYKQCALSPWWRQLFAGSYHRWRPVRR